MNKKGFSLVEVLAVIALLGILSGVAIGAVTGYLEDAKNQSYNSIFSAASNACEIYILDNGIQATLEDGEVGSVTLEELVEGEYMTNPTDPNSKTDCTGQVEYKLKKGSGKVADTIIYRVTLNCPGRPSSIQQVFPKGNSF